MKKQSEIEMSERMKKREIVRIAAIKDSMSIHDYVSIEGEYNRQMFTGEYAKNGNKFTPLTD